MDKDYILIKKMKNGDENAMDEFVNKFYPCILKYCYYHTSSKECAEDITQDTFVKFFGALTDYIHCGKTLNYLYRIAGNLCKDLYKSDSKVQYKCLNECESEINQIPEVDTRIVIQQALTKLPDELREIIILYYYQDIKIKDIAKILHIGVPLVKYRMKRAKCILEDILERE